MAILKFTAGKYEVNENILHLWFPRRVDLIDEKTVRVFFDEVIADWIGRCPTQPHLLVNFDNLHIRPNMAASYAENLKRFQPMLLGTYRYNVPASFTGVTVALGNLKLAAPANIFPDEHTAREAIRLAREGAAAPSRRRSSRAS